MSRASARLASLASGRPSVTFSRTLAENNVASSNAVATVARSSSRRRSRMSHPPMEMHPAVTSYSRGTNSSSVVLPDPVAPTSAMVSPSRMVKSTPRSTSSSASGYRKRTSWNSSPRGSDRSVRRWPVDDRGLLVEYLEDSSRRRRRFLGEGKQPAEGDHRPDQPQVQRQEGDELSRAERAVCGGEHSATGNTREQELRKTFQQRPEPRQRADFGEFRAPARRLRHG
jgi:hypothetical protein